MKTCCPQSFDKVIGCIFCIHHKTIDYIHNHNNHNHNRHLNTFMLYDFSTPQDKLIIESRNTVGLPCQLFSRLNQTRGHQDVLRYIIRYHTEQCNQEILRSGKTLKVSHGPIVLCWWVFTIN